MYGRRYFRGFMQIHSVWFVRKDGAFETWKDAKMAGRGDHKPDGSFCGQRLYGQDFEGEAERPKGSQGHLRDSGFTGSESG